jgi:hypothetical protein
MKHPTMSEKQWQIAEKLARELGFHRVSKNVLEDAISFLNRAPNPKRLSMSECLEAWLKRYIQLGGTFAAGDVQRTSTERGYLADALLPVINDFPNQNWPLILGWTARLMLYYSPQDDRRGFKSNRPRRPSR